MEVEDSVGAGAASVDDTLRNTLVVDWDRTKSM
jgi:hypothetical protein